jgi:predicted histidine transporter YuiF (NhaC family)
MTKLKELLRSPHIQIALATGASIIVMAYVSKRILPESIGYISLAIPPFLATLYESLLSKYKNSKLLKTWYWITAIFAATALIIIIHAL